MIRRRNLKPMNSNLMNTPDMQKHISETVSLKNTSRKPNKLKNNVTKANSTT